MARYSSRDLKQFAQRGAAVRVAELEAEIASITKQFKIRGNGVPRGPYRRRRRGVQMTAAQRADVSRRMKKYWAARRKAKAAAKA